MSLHQLATNAEKAVYCQGRQEIYVLTESGKVTCYTGLKESIVYSIVDIPNTVHDIAASFSHVLFYSAGYDPIYALGSNRFSQLGVDYQQSTSIETPFPVDFFCGLGDPSGAGDGSVQVNAIKSACGSSHTIVLDDKGRIWICGANNYGQLGDPKLGLVRDVFCQWIPPIKSKAIDCYAGRWNTFILTSSFL
ncbi:regulator of chromosome condensation 1/beta-lactamase-inhibitor protein II [Phycomyces nitens]|nr:regulator of chromosome condensation 1/beta-lactamase-inhibitor protein II [Phycomyces nitens]